MPRHSHMGRAVRALLALLVTLVLMGVLLAERARQAEQTEQMAARIVGTSWELSEFLFEAQRFDTALADILGGRIPVSDLLLRHDILWSRLDVVRARALAGQTTLAPLLREFDQYMEANSALLYHEPDLTFLDIAQMREDLQARLGQVRAFWVSKVVANQGRIDHLPLSLQGAEQAQAVKQIIIVCAIALLAIYMVAELFLSAHDMRRERALHAEARKGSAAKSRFIANVSHEVRTPLNGLLGMAQVLRDTDLTKDQRELLDTISASGENLLALLNQLLDLSKIEAGRMELAPHPTDLDALLQRLALSHRAAAQAKGLGFETWFPKEVEGTFLLDALRVQQVVNNLLSNAIKFTESGHVGFEAGIDKGADGARSLVNRVSDTGIGLDQDALKRVFEPFTQADASTTRRFGGTGLGLAVVREICTLAGGDVGVDSTPGAGSCFTLRLPVERVAAGAPASSTPGTRVRTIDWREGMALLIVDDSRINRQVLRRFLEPLGARIEEAANGAEGLEIACAQRFDAILLDVQMPVLDGVHATRKLRAHEAAHGVPPVPVIGVTANAQPDRLRNTTRLA